MSDTEDMKPVPVTCKYSAAHARQGVPAVAIIDCGPVGQVPACGECAERYKRLNSG
jgi:hypothetical protein